MVVREHQRSAQALKIAERIERQFRGGSHPALAQQAAQARLSTVPALVGLGRLQDAFAAMQATLASGAPAIAALTDSATRARDSDGPAPRTASAGLAMARAMAVERLGDSDQTLAAYDAFIEQHRDEREPMIRLFVWFARGFRRKAQRNQQATAK